LPTSSTGFGGVAVMTAASHATGTDRLAEVASHLNAEIVVNVQGDEPVIMPESIDAAVRLLLDRPRTRSAPYAAPSTALKISPRRRSSKSRSIATATRSTSHARRFRSPGRVRLSRRYGSISASTPTGASS
jgi:CMP-2-keto-3-deoxyoctulosonic acid synthetase